MRAFLLAVHAAALSLPTFSQTALLREGDASPDGSAGSVVTSIFFSAVNQTDGYGCRVVLDGSRSEYWGDLNGGPGAVLRSPSTIGGATQTTLGQSLPFGLSSTSVGYAAIVDIPGGTEAHESFWVDDSLVLLQTTPRSGTNVFWNEVFGGGVTETGAPYFMAGTREVPTVTGPSTLTGIFIGSPPVALYESFMVLPNAPAPLDRYGVRQEYGISANGTHNIARLVLEDLIFSSGSDEFIALDGSGLVLGGGLVQEGSPVPAAIGGSGDSWRRFVATGIADGGDYFFADQAHIVRNGRVWLQNGDVVDGETLEFVSHAHMNESNRLAHIWRVAAPSGNPLALFYEGRLLVKEGDLVDWDGDGALDPNATIDALGFPDSLRVDSDGDVYFIADVDVSGTVLRGFFRHDIDPIGVNYCAGVSNTSGSIATMSAIGTDLAQANELRLTARYLPQNQFGIFVTSMTQDFVAGAGGSSNGNLCLGGAIGRINIVRHSGPAGEYSLDLDLAALPQGNGSVAAMSGETWYFQSWFRDQVGLGSNYTNGLEVLFR